jgi:PAS domain S-box-containing protein
VTRVDAASTLFSTAFRQSRNAMVLVDDRRRHVDMNGAYLRLVGHPAEALLGRPIYELVVGGPLESRREWLASLAGRHFDGEAELRRSDGTIVPVQWAAASEVVSGRRLVLFVALSTSRSGRTLRREAPAARAAGTLTAREREIVRLVSQGRSGPEIAEELQLAHDTVRTHVRNAMTKTGARSRAHLVAKALADGLVLA